MKYKDENQIRQGDILLRDVCIEKEEKLEGSKSGRGRKVLAYGETTGHSHMLDGNVEYYDNGNSFLIASVRGSAELVHEEHGIIEVPKGDYLVIRQRELDIVEGIRRVSD